MFVVDVITDRWFIAVVIGSAFFPDTKTLDELALDVGLVTIEARIATGAIDAEHPAADTAKVPVIVAGGFTTGMPL